MECVDLTKHSVKIIGTHSSYNKKIENEKNFMRLIVKKRMFSKFEEQET